LSRLRKAPSLAVALAACTFGFERYFILAASKLFAPVGQLVKRRSIQWTVPSSQDISGIRDGERLILVPPPRAQFVDLYVLDKHSPNSAKQAVCDAYVIQVTQNPQHAPSHRAFETKPLKFLGGRSALDALRERGVNGTIYFVYVTDFHSPRFLSDLSYCDAPVESGSFLKLLKESSHSKALHEYKTSSTNMKVLHVQITLHTLQAHFFTDVHAPPHSSPGIDDHSPGGRPNERSYGSRSYER
jgi:hypothetical protein